MNYAMRWSNDGSSASSAIGCDPFVSSPSTLLVILNRWHWLGRPGTYLVTLVCGRWSENVNAVMDDFGNLILLA